MTGERAAGDKEDGEQQTAKWGGSVLHGLEQSPAKEKFHDGLQPCSDRPQKTRPVLRLGGFFAAPEERSEVEAGEGVFVDGVVDLADDVRGDFSFLRRNLDVVGN
ncbi:MAG: hypothetical protein RL095_1253 [Verrucomicrobiota bacterium]